MMRNRRVRQSAPGNISALNHQVAIDCSEATGVFLQILATAISATFVLEGSIDSPNGTDGTWVRIGMSATNATNLYTQTADTGALTTPPIAGWVARVVPFRWVRVRCSAWTSGTSVRAILLGYAGAI